METTTTQSRVVGSREWAPLHSLPLSHHHMYLNPSVNKLAPPPVSIQGKGGSVKCSDVNVMSCDDEK
jgi:hypothetical protein